MAKGRTPGPKIKKPREQTKKVWDHIYLKGWREHRGLSTEGLADKSGVSPGLISQIEGGTSGGSAGSLQKLAKALDIEVGELFDVAPEEGGRILRLWVPDDVRPLIEEILSARSRIKKG